MATTKLDKVIVTNLTALLAKYGASLTNVQKAIGALIKSDLKRGLHTSLIGLDDAAAMRPFGASPVGTRSGPRQYKAAIDAGFKSLTPDYLMILGAIDVVPHQDLANPTDDEDSTAWGDLPYACEAPYSKQVADFRAPTRVVGRLPDVTGGSDAGYLVGVLNKAAHYQPLSPSNYTSNLGISAEVWKKSTAESLRSIFSNDKGLKLSPPQGPKWAPTIVGRASHFINCHGAPADFRFYGQRGAKYPVAHDATRLAGRVTHGSIVAAECCYGAELYDPSLDGVPMGICNTYLAEGAYGFFGSSTIAYGPAEGNDAADLICQYFLQRVLAGASLGRAALEARQTFVRTVSPLDPQNLKTLGQFSLMADPAIVAAETTTVIESTKTLAAVSKSPDQPAPSVAFGRGLRRARLTDMGLAIGAAAGFAAPTKKQVPLDVQAALRAVASEYSPSKPGFSRYDVEFGGPRVTPRSMAMAVQPERPVAFHLATCPLPKKNQQKGLPLQRVVIVATQLGDTMSIRRLFTR